MNLDILQTPTGMMDVLLYLSRRESAFATEAISDMGMNRGTFYAGIAKLLRLGMIFERKEIGFPIRAYYGLTLRGEETARHLASVAALMKETVDSLERELKDLERAKGTKKNLERRFEILQMFEEERFLSGEWDEALVLGEKARLVASELADEAKTASVELWVGRILQKRCDEECLAHLDASHHAALKADDPVVAAEAAYLRGCHHERAGRSDRAETEYRLASELAARADSKLGVGRAELGLGRLLVARGRHPQARETLEKARKLLEEESGVEELPMVYASLGAASFYENVEEALRWHEKAIRSCELHGFIRLLAYELGNAAQCLEKLGDSKEPLQHLARAVDLAEKLEDPKLRASVLIQRASIKMAGRTLKDAERDLRTVIDMAEEEELLRERAHAHYLLGDILKRRTKATEAKRSFNEAVELFKRLGDEGMAERVGSELRNLSR